MATKSKTRLPDSWRGGSRAKTYPEEGGWGRHEHST